MADQTRERNPNWKGGRTVSLCVLRPGVCAKQADCPDHWCPGRAEAIAMARELAYNVCQDDCPTREACGLPERPPQFRPTFDLEGPHFPREEMLGQIATMTHPQITGPRFHLETPEEHHARLACWQRPAATDPNGGAEIPSTPEKA